MVVITFIDTEGKLCAVISVRVLDREIKQIWKELLAELKQQKEVNIKKYRKAKEAIVIIDNRGTETLPATQLYVIPVFN
jgi:hypothetical protein